MMVQFDLSDPRGRRALALSLAIEAQSGDRTATVGYLTMRADEMLKYIEREDLPIRDGR